MDTSDLIGRLLQGEKIVWWGQPAQGLLLTSRDWLLIPFSLLWGGFAIFWEMSVLDTNGPIFMKLWGVPFVLAGLYLVAGRFLFDAWVRRRMCYAVTDKRVLILRSGPFSKFSAIGLNQLQNVNLSERADGRGTIRFGAVAPSWADQGFSSRTPSLDSTPQFIAIEDARRVFDHIQRAVAMGT
jgi:Bacterial PH domain